MEVSNATQCDICGKDKEVILICPHNKNICLDCVENKEICDWEDNKNKCWDKCYTKYNC